MYCRACGNEMSDNYTVCRQCGAKKGEGVNHCHACGYYTTIKTEYCSNCGAKQRTIITQQMKKGRLDELQKKLKYRRIVMKIEKFIAIFSFISLIALVVILLARPEPNNIPAPSNMQISSNTFMHDSFFKVGDTYYYSSDISDDVAEYWVQGRELLMYIVSAMFVFCASFISYLIQKSAYKKLLKAIKEVKNVL